MKAAWLSASVVVIAVVTACGSNDDDVNQGVGEQASESITKAQFIVQADEVCERSVEGDLLDEHEQATDQGDLEEAANLLERANEILRQGIAEVRALPKPAGEESQIDRWFSELDQQLALRERFLVNLRQRDHAHHLPPTRAKDFSAMADAFAQGFGFTVCGTA